MDNQLVFDLFTRTIKAAEILKTDNELVSKLTEAVKRLPPMQIGKWGQLQEWMYDWDNQDDKHRHVSHLYGLFPQIRFHLIEHQNYFQLQRRPLSPRGDESTGWSMGWKVNLWARLLDGDHAYKLITDQLTPSIQPDGQEREEPIQISLMLILLSRLMVILVVLPVLLKCCCKARMEQFIYYLHFLMPGKMAV